MKRFPEIDKIIQEFQLQEIRDEIYENLVERIAIETTEKEDYSKLGNSRLGGFPDLPIDFQYPLNEKGEYLRFLAQINCSEIQIENSVLPKKGIIYFFEGDGDETFSKAFFSKNTSLITKEPPEGGFPCSGFAQNDYDDTWYVYHPFKITFKNSIQLKWFDKLYEFTARRDEFESKICGEDPISQLLGEYLVYDPKDTYLEHSGLGGVAFLSDFWSKNEEGYQNLKNKKDWDKFNSEREMHIKKTDDLIHLFRITENKTGMDWGHGLEFGIQFHIEKSRLLKEDFSIIYACY